MTRLLLAAVVALSLHAGMAALRLPKAHERPDPLQTKKSLNIRVIGIHHPAPEQSITSRLPQPDSNDGGFHGQVEPQRTNIELRPLKADEAPLPVKKKNERGLQKKSSKIIMPPNPEREQHSSPLESDQSKEQGLKEVLIEAPHAPLSTAVETQAPPPKTHVYGDASGGTIKDDGLIREASPSYLNNPPPSYPAIARKRGYEGTVILEVFVDEKGNAGQIRINSSSGYSVLDKAAMEAVAGWKFNPALRGGMPAASTIKVPVVFKLE